MSDNLTLDTRLTPEHLADIKRGGGVHKRAQERVEQFGLKQPGSGNIYRPYALHGNPKEMANIWPRGPWAAARIGRIVEGSYASAGKSFEETCRTATVPKLAARYLELYAFYMFRDRPAPNPPRVDHNPFRHLSDFDAFRKFTRMVEDICDASSAQLGGWYVK